MSNICEFPYISFEFLKTSNAKVAFDQVSRFHVSKTAKTNFKEGGFTPILQ